jgi:hypothetical protein
VAASTPLAHELDEQTEYGYYANRYRYSTLYRAAIPALEPRLTSGEQRVRFLQSCSGGTASGEGVASRAGEVPIERGQAKLREGVFQIAGGGCTRIGAGLVHALGLAAQLCNALLLGLNRTVGGRQLPSHRAELVLHLA